MRTTISIFLAALILTTTGCLSSDDEKDDSNVKYQLDKLKEDFHTDGSIDLITQFSYDTNGRVTNSEEIEPESDLHSNFTTYSDWNSHGDPLSYTVDVDGDDVVDYSGTFTYNDHDYVEFKTFIWPGETDPYRTDKYSYAYQSNGKPYKRTEYDFYDGHDVGGTTYRISYKGDYPSSETDGLDAKYYVWVKRP